jgi:hypothetical protein
MSPILSQLLDTGLRQAIREAPPLYTVPNSPSSPPLRPITMNDNQNLMALDTDEHVTKLKSGLSKVREEARVQQNTLDDILQLLWRLPIVEPERPRNPNQIPGAPATTPRVTTSMTLVLDSSPHLQACGLKPATPNEFDGNHLKGWAFLNSCRLYIALC